MNKYSLELISRLLDYLSGDGREAFPVPESDREKKLCDTADDFWVTLMNVIAKDCDASEKDGCIKYAYAKIYAFYNNETDWYYDAYIWEKEANTYFPNITVGCYILVRDFMSFLEAYKNGRI